MSFQYFWYEELSEAQAQSGSKWISRLGHPKNPGDVTAFIWPIIPHPQGSYFLLQVHDSTFDLLSPAEMGDLMSNRDPLVLACYPPMPGGGVILPP